MACTAAGSLAAGAGRLGFGSRGFGRRRLFRGAFGLVIGFIETGPLENDAGAGSDKAAEGELGALRAFFQFFFGHGLQNFKSMSA